MRALWLACPDDPDAARLGDEYLWGPEILVAPVVEKGATTRKLYLPRGDWIDWWTNAPQKGGQWIERPVDLATMPIYVKAGAIIPIDPVRQWTGEKTDEPTTLRIFPGAAGEFTLYDDDGHSMNYADSTDPSAHWIKATFDGQKLTLDKGASMKSWPAGLTRKLKIQRFPDGKPQEVEFKGERLEFKGI
jgi:alpha-glucosidase/alpha-D-xyloside xylohydrolase